jgi:hypothetical protein
MIPMGLLNIHSVPLPDPGTGLFSAIEEVKEKKGGKGRKSTLKKSLKK